MPYKNGTTCRADEIRSRDYGGTEGNGTEEMGRLDEQCMACCGGSCDKGTGICVIVCGVGNCSAFIEHVNDFGSLVWYNIFVAKNDKPGICGGWHGYQYQA